MEKIVIGESPFKTGDRVKGLYSLKGKEGVVIRSSEHFSDVKWDGARRKSTVQTHKLEKLDEATTAKN